MAANWSTPAKFFAEGTRMADKDSHARKPLAREKDFAPDERRKHLTWLALSLIALLGLAFVIVISYGYEAVGDYFTESLLLIGLLAFLTCTVAYFADNERDQRAENRKLIQQLKETAEALDARVVRLNKLCETSTHLAGNLDIERISELVVEALVAQVSANAASLVLVDKARGKCLHTCSVSPLGEVQVAADAPTEIAEAALGEPEAAVEVLDDGPDVSRLLNAWNRTRDAISAPLRVSDVVGGALAAIREDSFSTEEFNLLRTLANMASKAIESAELHEELEKSYMRLRQSYFNTLHVLAGFLAARDPYTAAHGEIVTSLATCLAERLALGADAIQALRAYGPLHDVGKIGIPDAVLLKKEPLTEAELELCHQHTLIGEEIIRPLDASPAVLSIIRSHHERWDGRGYPDRLKGEQIPILARVVAVADVFHDMVSARAYKGGTIPSLAVREIKDHAGSQFDPTVVQLLVDLWDSGELANVIKRPPDAADASLLAASVPELVWG